MTSTTTRAIVSPRRRTRVPLSVASPAPRRGKLIANLVLAALGIVFVVPIAWIVFSAIDPAATVSISLPEAFTLDNFSAVLTYSQTILPLWNSALISFGTAALTVVVGVLAAYPLSRFRQRFQRGFLYGVLFGSCLPITALMVPVYAMFVQLKLLDSLVGVILFMSATSLPMAIWMLKNFMDSVPISLEEAAWVDGASAMRALGQIVLPLMRPGIGVVFIFVFTQAWGNFFVPFVLLFSAEKMPAAVAIFTFFGNHGAVAYGQLAAFAMLYSVPILVLYLVMQRITGSSFALAGGLKG
ncbi:carbohydrate ABC transporter permease [Microbacterium sp. cx-55]|uniref:carbohydrate ABC transporter permease n=1 Tax=unclassified Microbacterium TaxID=2609290 RepID=UPI001CBAEA94|nr:MULTISPECIES: carbohydrate ABC transporter permease [unclassified Microbacterium]MBZ4487853.1 carbohydrate ABC transporter permease [Microbacterium sp. cx-55]MCC4909121.1 carbohydrate ABC transporter permease [Microbacterium sp. cx-59]UGB34736.1 carbohydrate ABC transporter permease [Microbacterium sp. cx-55]